jgi:hypothetical protein
MPVAKPPVSKIPDTAPEFITSAPEISVVKHNYSRPAERLDRGNVIAEAPRQPVEPLASSHAEAVSAEIRVREEASSGTRVRTLVPGAIPIRMVPVVPGVLGARHESAA